MRSIYAYLLLKDIARTNKDYRLSKNEIISNSHKRVQSKRRTSVPVIRWLRKRGLIVKIAGDQDSYYTITDLGKRWLKSDIYYRLIWYILVASLIIATVTIGLAKLICF